MEHSKAQRRLVKSPPELWAEVSSEDALSRRLAQFGEIRITRVEPETTVAWEGSRASGTVQLEAAGWGTKVILTATAAQTAAVPAADSVELEPIAVAEAARPEPEPAPEPARIVVQTPSEPAPAATPPRSDVPKVGFFARLFRRHAPELAPPPPAAPDPGPPAPDPEPLPPAPDPAPTAVEPVAAQPVAAAPPGLDRHRTAAILSEVLDDLGAAHHRPFSRD